MEAEAGLWVTKEDEAAAAVWCRSQEERYFLLLPVTSCYFLLLPALGRM